MRWFKNLPIRNQLVLGFGIVIFLLAFVSFMAYLALMEADRSQKFLYDRYFGNVYDLGTLKTHLNAERLDVATLLELQPSEREPWLLDLKERSRANNEIIQRLLIRFHDDAQDFAKLGELKEVRESFEKTRDTQIFPLLEAGNIEEAKKLYLGINLARYIKMRDIARDLEKSEVSEARLLVEETIRQNQSYVVLSLLLGVAAVLLTLGLAVFLHRTVMDYIAQRRKAEQELRTASRYARSLIEASLDPLVTISAEGRITDVNQATEEATGLARDELVGSDFTSYFTEPEQARLGYRQVLAQGQVRDYPLSIRHVTGRIMDVIYNASLFRNEVGEVQGVFAAARDITKRKQAEQEAAQLGRQNRLILDSAGEGIYGLDLEGQCTFINPAATQMLGFSAEELIGRHSHRMFHHTRPDGRPYSAEECPVQAAYKQGVVYRGAGLYWRKDGSSLPVEFVSTPVMEEGAIVGAVVTFSDITERKRAEETARKYAEELEDLYNHAPCGYHSLNGDALIVRINDTELALLGYSREELVNEIKFPDLLTPSSLQTFQENFPLFKERGWMRDLEFEIVRKDGRILPVLVNTTAIQDEAGNVLMSRSTLYDMSERKQAEAALRRASQYNRSLIEASLDPLVTIGPDGKITDVNAATEVATGYSRNALIGQEFAVYFAQPDKARAGYQQVFRDGQVRDYALEIRHRDGHLTPVLYNAALYRDESGEVIGIFAAARDITERKQAEEQLGKYRDHLEELVRLRTAEIQAVNKELEAFAYSVSHDLRVPLRAVDGFSRILLEDYQGTLDAEGQRLLNIVRDNAQKMGRLIDDILAFSRMGRKEITFSAVDMEALAHEVFDELQPLAEERDILLDIHPMPIAQGDPSLLRQVIVNLLGNAIKFTRPRPTARIEVGAQTGERETVYYVKDNGAGFDMQYADKLFGVFQRLHGGGEFEGTGIGLAIVKRVIDRHGGRVWAEGKIDEGATLFFALPVTRET